MCDVIPAKAGIHSHERSVFMSSYPENNIKTKRLLLRRWRDNDVIPFAEMNADSRIMEFYPALLSLEESALFIKHAEEKFERNGFGFWAMEHKTTGEFLGFVGLNIPNFEATFTPCVEIGWRLRFDHWNNGYATEGANAVLDYAFNKAKLNEVLAWTYRGNLRSRRLMERIGMSYDSNNDFEHPALPKDHWLRPHVLYRIEA